MTPRKRSQHSSRKTTAALNHVAALSYAVGGTMTGGGASSVSMGSGAVRRSCTTASSWGVYTGCV